MNIESLNDEELKMLEAKISKKLHEIKETHQHYGSVENLSDSDIKSLEAQVSEKRNKIFHIKNI